MGFILFVFIIAILYKALFGAYMKSAREVEKKKQRVQTIAYNEISEKEAKTRYLEAKARFEKTGNQNDKQMMLLEEKFWLDLCRIHSEEYLEW